MEPRSGGTARRVLVATVVVNLIVYVLSGFVLHRSRGQYEDEARTATQNLSQVLAVTVEGVLHNLDTGLAAVEGEVERQLQNGAIEDDRLNDYIASQLTQLVDFQAIWVSDNAGAIQWGTDISPGEPVMIADRDYFQELRDRPDAGLALGKPVIGRVTQAWSLLVARRIEHPDGSFAGVAVGSLRVVDYFGEMFSGVDVGDGGLIALRGKDLNVYVRYDAKNRTVTGPEEAGISPDGERKLRERPESGWYSASSAIDGVERLFSYQKVHDQSLYIFVALDPDDFLAPWWRYVKEAVVFLGSFTVLSALYGLSIVRRSRQADRLRLAEAQNERLEQHSEEIERALLGTVDAISHMMDVRDPYTAGHERRVGELAAAIAAQIGLDDETQRWIRIAGGVQDIGNITVPTEILSAPRRLTPVEKKLVENHVATSYEILADIELPWPVAEVVRQHHERMDGSGYPHGLQGDEILLPARILAVADTVAAMTSHRPYRAALGTEAALEEISRHRGQLYDAGVVDACLQLFRERSNAIPNSEDIDGVVPSTDRIGHAPPRDADTTARASLRGD